ncbi:MAG: diaminopropionate ammonia-lyase [Gammaproteobacteria bacterium]|jgi:diaminopropionate ammonia-lyase
MMQQVEGTISIVHNTKADYSSLYDDSLKKITSLDKAGKAVETIQRWPGYRETSLHKLSSLAEDLKIAQLWYKDEAERFDLKSFKALGGAYAVARQIQARILEQTGKEASVDQLLNQEFKTITDNLVISCATDGNHGRSVAWGCQMFGCECIIYIHRDVSIGRQTAMESFGARVIRITGNYDDSVKQADQEAKKLGRCIVSDTSYEGYMDIPRDVALGYTVLLEESVRQMNHEIPTHVFIQGGVGGLASAVCAYFWELWGESRPRFIVVEPEQANCLQASAVAGEPVTVEGDLDTLMAGLACGEVSLLAWEILKTGANDFLTINETTVPKTMQLLAKGFGSDPSIEAGESAVAGIAALITICNNASDRLALGIDESSKVYILGTEGATDPDLYQQLLNQPE